MRSSAPGHTVLTGTVRDQAHLHGLIERIPSSASSCLRQPADRGAMTAPDTIVLIHGFWVTPRSWEHWIAPLRGARASSVLAPAYPGFEVEVEALNADPSPIEARHGAADHRAPRGRRRRARRAADPDRATRPAACSPRSCSTTASAPRAWRSTRRRPRASSASPLSQVKATFPVLKNPANRHRAVGFTHEQWHYAFTNALQRGGVARALRALPHPRVRRDLLGQRARQHPPRPRRHLRRTTTTTTARRCCSSPAARTT